MKWASHKRITGKIGKHFGIKETKELTEASILPDKEYDYRVVKVKKRGRTYEKKVRLRHHLEPFIINKIIEYTIEARRWKVKNSKYYITPLGKAAHYIQDNVIDPRKKVLFFKVRDMKTHDRIEAKIDRMDVPFEEVYKVESMKFTLSDFERELKRRKPSTDPVECVHNATFLTAMLIKLVVNPEYPEDFWKKYRRSKIVSVFFVLGGITAIAAAYYFWWVPGFVVGGLSTLFGLLNPFFWKKHRDAKFYKGDV